MPENQPQQPKDPSQEDSKQLKKLLESHLSVLEHKLGRPPTIDELTAFLQGGSQEAPKTDDQGVAQEAAKDPAMSAPKADPLHESEPKVLSYKVYYGMKAGADGARAADPRKVLFYETGDGKCYDTTRHEWASERPQVIDHLPSRPMLFDEQGHDIMSALVHGVLDDEDYSALDKAEMLNEHHKKIWELNKQLQSQMGQLVKSEEAEDDTEEEPEAKEEAAETPKDEAAESPEKQAAETKAGTEQHDQSTPEKASPATDGGYGEPEQGQVINAVEEIIRAALANAKADSEQQIKDLVASEFSRHMNAFIAALEQGEEPTQDFGTLDTQSQPAPAATEKPA